jgi:hypothetical protein
MFHNNEIIVMYCHLVVCQRSLIGIMHPKIILFTSIARYPKIEFDLASNMVTMFIAGL